jgi:hypothetical protein
MEDRLMTQATSNTLRVEFYKQGGKPCVGTAIGRKGKSLLIQYHIQTGEPRKRWLAPGRIIALDGDIDTLPRYRQVSCKGTTFDKPITWRSYPATRFYWDPRTDVLSHYDCPHYECNDPEALERTRETCPKCGKRHEQVCEYPRGNSGRHNQHYVIVGLRSTSAIVKVED